MSAAERVKITVRDTEYYVDELDQEVQELVALFQQAQIQAAQAHGAWRLADIAAKSVAEQVEAALEPPPEVVAIN